jgi:hypothetical protein
VWFSRKFHDSVEFYGSAEYKFSYKKTSGGSKLIPWQLDAGLLYLTGLNRTGTGSALEWTAGRMPLPDISSWLMYGRADGVSVSWYHGRFHIGAGAFYTGLVLKDNSNVCMSAEDTTDDSDDDVFFAPRRVIYKADSGITQAFAGQDIDIQLTGQNDLRSDTGKRLDSYYATLMLSGDPLPLTSYRLGATTALLQGTQTGIAQLAFLNVTVFIPWKSSQLVWESVYTTPLTGGNDGFISIAPRKISYVDSDLEPGNTGCTSLDFSFRPAQHLTVGIKGSSYFRTTLDTVEVQGFDNDSNSYYLGSEGQLYINCAATSELKFLGSCGIFQINPYSVDDDADTLLYRFTLSATLEI